MKGGSGNRPFYDLFGGADSLVSRVVMAELLKAPLSQRIRWPVRIKPVQSEEEQLREPGWTSKTSSP